MFNFSANNMVVVSKREYDESNVFVLKDRTTNRCYKIYDFLKTACFELGKPYCIFGKVNSSDKIYLVLDGLKEDRRNSQ